MAENRKLRDHTNIIKYAKIAYTLKRFIKAININTNEISCFRSKSKCAKYFDISPAMVYLICEHKNMYKSANTNKGKVKFEYVDENDVENLVEIPHGKLGKTYEPNPNKIYKTTDAQRNAIKKYQEKIRIKKLEGE